MTMHLTSSRSPQSQPAIWVALLGFAILALVATASIYAQVSGDRGIAPVASTTDIEVRGVKVNVSGRNAIDARNKGWREAQRLAWAKIGGAAIADSRLESLVSAIVVQKESIGPRRYVATLGVIFDRQRAGSLLGGGGQRARSAPMLVLPVLAAGGSQTMFEVRNPWQKAWAEYQFGASAIDYVRPTGGGGESLLLTYGQTSRRSRVWWNNLLDQYSAADVLVPIVKLEREYPGGPFKAQFTARYGPDNRFLAQFSMEGDSEEALPEMLSEAVERFDQIYTRALAMGTLRPDPTLSLNNLEISPEILALLEEARAAEAAEYAAANPVAVTTTTEASTGEEPVAEATEAAAVAASYTVQVPTPDAASFDAALSGLRSAGGVSGVSVSSTAMGGTSVMQVTFTGELSALAAALRAQGWNVVEGDNALAISR